ncbi:hypothetical protein WJX84_001806 [Apatococcus fuscideae]|uniref:Uncharacterized protein n=1 Tax=Apatococcus fuscideae TaxID=2026836 RepID=A0AAW1S4I6_9CHLO
MAFSSQKLNFKRQRPADDSKQGKGFGRLFRYAVTSSRVCPLSLVLTVAPVQEALAQALPALLLPTSGPDCHPRQLLLSRLVDPWPIRTLSQSQAISVWTTLMTPKKLAQNRWQIPSRHRWKS